MKKERDLEDLESRMKKEVARCAKNKVYCKSVYTRLKGRHDKYCTYYFPSNLHEPYECPFLGNIIMVKKVSAPGMYHWVQYYRCRR